jgi:hypothetical protein
MKITLHKIWLLVLLLAASATVQAQAPAWQSVTTTTNVNTPQVNSSSSHIRATATDASGNVFVVGTYAGSVTLGAINLVPATGYTGLFVAKWSPVSNSFVWAQQASGVFANAIAVSGTSIYIAGSIYNSTTLGTTTIAPGANDTGFIAKLTDSGSSGSFVWAQQLGGRSNNNSGLMGLAVSGSSVYATGSFVTSTASFGTYTLSNNSTAVQWQRPEELYLAKLTDAGTTATIAWVQQAPAASGAKTGWPYGVATSGGNVYVTGRGPEAFVVKFTDAGSYQWTSNFGGTYAVNNGITIPASLIARGSDLYVAGQFTGSASFGSTTLTQPTGSTLFSSDIFVTKLHDNGASATQGWALQAGGTDVDSATAIVASSNGLYVAGVYKSPNASFGSTILANAGYADACVARIVENGSNASFAWALSAGGPSLDRAEGLALSGSNVYVVGHAVLPAQFGALTTPVPVGSTNALAGFLARITDVALPTRAAQLAADALYPNPAHGAATVRVPATAEATTATLTLLDGLGRAVRVQAAPTGATVSFNLTGLAPGVYALRVQAGAAVATQKLAVE